MAGFGMKIVSTLLVAADAMAIFNHHFQATSYNDSLPPTEEILANKDKVFRDVTSSIGTFQQRMQAVRAENTQAIENQRASYDQQLQAQDAENKQQLELNEVIGQSVETYRAQNRQLRERAQKMSNANNKLAVDIESMKSNVTLAQEFATEALVSAKQRLDNASALTILDKLDQADDKKSREESHQNKMAYVGGASDGLVALQVKATLESPKELLQSLLIGLDNLKNEQNESEVTLKKHFQTALQKMLDVNSSVMEQQVALNESEFKEKSLNERLHNAVDHLEDTHQLLSTRAEALRTFFMRLGVRPMPSAAKPNIPPPPAGPPPATPSSLMQISAEEHHFPSLPAIKKVLEKPIDVMQTMTSNVQALQQRLVEVQGSNEDAVEIQKRKYEETLDGQEVENHKLEKQINQLALDIKALRSSNLDLRGQALQLQGKSAALRSNLSSLMENMTTAQEIAATALANAEQNLHNSSELKVLIELAANDLARAEDQLHKNRLQAVDSGDEVAMLQVTSGPQQSAEELLGMMTSTLVDLAVEQNASLASLQQSFGEESRKNEAHQQALLDEMAKLTTTKSAQQKLNDRLNVAVSHLGNLHDSLTERKKSLESFLVTVGGGNEDMQEHEKKTKKAAEKRKEKSTSKQTAVGHKPTKVETAEEKSSIMSSIKKVFR